MQLRNNIQRVIAFIICVAVPVIIGMVSSLLTGDMEGKYEMMTKTPLSPPGSLFGIVWPILYVMMGISLFFILNSSKMAKDKKGYIIVFIIQLIVNFLWSPIFFAAGGLWLAVPVIFALDILIIILMVQAKKVNTVSVVLLIPYLIWILFATYLNISFALLN